MAPEELVYDFAFEALLRGVGSLSRETKARAEALGIRFDQKLLPAYPKAAWIDLVDAFAAQVAPGRTRADAHFALGERMTHGFEQTTIGKVMAPAVRTMGVAWLLRRTPKNFTMANNFLKVRLDEEGPRSVIVHFSEAAPSLDFLRGCLDAMARYAGARDVSIEATQLADGSARIDVRWT
jgi:uncharacterized protein (TIGR02265 family)